MYMWKCVQWCTVKGLTRVPELYLECNSYRINNET